MTPMFERRKFSIALAVALLIHGCLFLWKPHYFVFTPSHERPIEVTRFEESPRPIVQTDRLQDQPEDDGTKAEFLGEKRSRTQKQMQARLKGRFQRGGRFRVKPRYDVDGDTPGEQGEEGSMSDLMAFSMTPNRIPDSISDGPQTLLNTDSVLYASFVNRVADEIYEPWVFHVNYAMEHLARLKKPLAASAYVTKITVVLNREGGVAAITTLKSCGVPDLDEATKKAFWDVTPFPNPPEQMFDEDGLVRFVYEFHFELKRSGFNIVPII